VACHALSDDSRVLPRSLVLPHAARLDEVILRCVTTILGVPPGEDITELARVQLSLPTQCAGLGIHPSTVTTPLARAAALAEGGPRLRSAVQAWDAPGLDPVDHDGVNEEVLDGLPLRLAALGIRAIGQGGSPSEAVRPGDPAVHLRPPVPARHLQSQYLKAYGEATYEELLRTSPPVTQCRLRSCAGPTAGTAFTAPLHLALK
jgi:hypothetical protein